MFPCPIREEGALHYPIAYSGIKMKAKGVLIGIIFVMISPIITFGQSKKIPKEFKYIMKSYASTVPSYRPTIENPQFPIIAFYEETGNFPDIKKIEKLTEKYNKKYRDSRLRYEVSEMKRQEIMKVFPTLISLHDQILEYNKYDFRLYGIRGQGAFLYDFTRAAILQNKKYNKSREPENALQDDELETIIAYYENICDEFYKTFGSYKSKSGLLKNYYKENMIRVFKSQIYFYNSTQRQERANNIVLKLVMQHPDLLKPIIDDGQINNGGWTNSDLIKELIELYNATGKFEQSHELLISLLNDSNIAKKGTFYSNGFNELYNKVSYILKDASSVSAYIFNPQDNLPLRYGDYSESTELLPIVNLSSQVLYSSVNFLGENNINNAFPTFIREGLQNGKLWPSYSGLTYTNTPTLNKILIQQPDIILLLENSYLPNIIHYQIVSGRTKVYFLADKTKNIVAVFDLPKSASDFKRIPLNYYSMSIPSKSSTGLYGYSAKKVEASALKDLKLNPFLNCDMVYEIKLEKERQEQIARDKKLQEERIAMEKLKEEKRKEEEQKQVDCNCNFVFTKPKLNITYIDNRMMCCYCKKRYAKHYSSAKSRKDAEELTYLGEILELHYQKVNADDCYKNECLKRYTQFVNDNYGMLAGLTSGMFSKVGVLFQSFFGKTMGSKNRTIDMYSIESNFCSPKCQDDCLYSSNCNCN